MTIRQWCFPLLVAGATLFPSVPSDAVEPFVTYDAFDGETIRSDLWRGFESGVAGGQEILRAQKKGSLELRYRREGDQGSNAGTVIATNGLNSPVAAAINQMSATAKVKSLEVTDCAANPAASSVRAFRVSLRKFNDGTSSGPGDSTGDYLAIAEVFRDSTDPDDGTVKARGILVRCTNFNCLQSVTVTPSVILGTVQIGRQFTLRNAWDPQNNQFLVGVDNGADVALPYPAGANVAPSAIHVAQLSQLNMTENCTAAPVVADSTIKVLGVQTNLLSISVQASPLSLPCLHGSEHCCLSRRDPSIAVGSCHQAT